MRLFIGIPLALATVRDLDAEVKRLQSTRTNPEIPGSFRWSDRESWHITLQFLGSTTELQYECVTAHLRELRHSQLSIELGRIGTFPRAGVLFVDVRVTSQLTVLQQAITAATARCGCTPEDRPYRPHITLARQKGKGDRHSGDFRNLKLHSTPAPHFTSFRAESFVLYQSVPTPQGSRYEIRERFPLHNPE
ncbi:MAG TPA: RNA 2',3'-cyclic phosphodiesterase [Acidobacteriaceae bacterium]